MFEPSEIAAQFYRIPFQKHTQLELLDDLRVCAPDLEELQNHIGTMHGGMLFALGEVATAVTMAALLAPERASLFAITRAAEIAYLKPARGAITGSCVLAMTREEILSALEVRRSVDVPVAVELKDASDVTVATLHVVWYVARKRP